MTDETRVLPQMIPLRTVAAELGRTVRSLVTASASGRFVALVAIGRDWYVRGDALQKWIDRNHALADVAAIRRAVAVADRAVGCQELHIRS